MDDGSGIAEAPVVEDAPEKAKRVVKRTPLIIERRPKKGNAAWMPVELEPAGITEDDLAHYSKAVAAVKRSVGMKLLNGDEEFRFMRVFGTLSFESVTEVRAVETR